MGRCVAFKAQSRVVKLSLGVHGPVCCFQGQNRVVKLSLGLGKDEFRINCAHKLASM